LRRVVFRDDERLARSELKRLLAPHDAVEVIAEAANAAEAEEAVQKTSPDLLLLDIQMPGASGFDLLERLETVPQVVFVMAYDEYAIRAFEVNALDYLVKPVEPERLARSLENVQERLAAGRFDVRTGLHLAKAAAFDWNKATEGLGNTSQATRHCDLPGDPEPVACEAR